MLNKYKYVLFGLLVAATYYIWVREECVKDISYEMCSRSITETERCWNYTPDGSWWAKYFPNKNDALSYCISDSIF